MLSVNLDWDPLAKYLTFAAFLIMRYPKLCKTLETLVHSCGSIDGRTRILKLAYLADKAWKAEMGSPYTEARYYRWNHGPFAREVLQALDWMDGVEIVQKEVQGYAGRMYLYEPGERTRLTDVKLDPKFELILLKVADTWKLQPLHHLLKHVYADATFKATNFGDPLLAP